MSAKEFIKLLLLSILSSFAAYSIISWLFPEASYLNFTILAVVIFTFLSLLAFYLGNRAINSKDKNFFISIVMVNVFIKLILSFLIIVAFVKIAEPPNKYYLVPFTLVYLIFTIFETIVLSRIAKP